MDELDIAEFHGREAAKFSLSGLDAARARAHALLLVLLGGGAGMGSLGLAQVTQSPLLAVAALAAAVWWFLLSGWVVLRALLSATVTSWTNPEVQDRLDDWQKWADAEAVSSGIRPDPVRRMRQRLCDTADAAAHGYRLASGRAYAALNGAYLGMTLTPLVSLLGLALWWIYLTRR